MASSSFSLRARFQESSSRCFSGLNKFFTAAVVAGCIASTAGVRPAFAKSAAELAMEVDNEADEGQVEIEYTGMRKLSPAENAVKYGGLIAVFGGGVVWSWRAGKREDREEEERVKAEVERIEQWKKEFIDMEDVVADDDLQASLSKRMSGEKTEGVDDADGSGGVPSDYAPEPTSGPDGGSAAEAEAEEERPAAIDAAQLERLKRMFGDTGGPK